MTPRIEAVVSDFGGVLTSPLFEAFARVQDELDLPPDALGRGLARATAEDGANPLFALETGDMSESAFLARLDTAVRAELGRPVALHDFAERYMAALEPNAALLDYYRALKGRGVRLALLTNNVREWEPRWRALLPVDELFETVVDSAFVGMRKPDPAIYALTLERLGLPAAACAFVDDVEVNVDAARELGLRAIRYVSAEQAIAELEHLLPAA